MPSSLNPLWLVRTGVRVYFCVDFSDLYFSAYASPSIHTNTCDCLQRKVVIATSLASGHMYLRGKQ